MLRGCEGSRATSSSVPGPGVSPGLVFWGVVCGRVGRTGGGRRSSHLTGEGQHPFPGDGVGRGLWAQPGKDKHRYQGLSVRLCKTAIMAAPWEAE